MKLALRYIRSLLFLFPAGMALATNASLEGLSIAFGIVALTGAFATTIYLFLHFDEKLNDKIVMELLADAFFGLILFTYPNPDGRFFLLVFSAWIFIMGLLFITRGLTKAGIENFYWFYLLTGITYIIAAFVITNYNPDFMATIPFVLGIVLVVYSFVNMYLMVKRKGDIYSN